MLMSDTVSHRLLPHENVPKQHQTKKSRGLMSAALLRSF